jgi:hypothetical protein
MGCNCGSKNRDVAYEVRFKDASIQRFNTVTEAQTAVRKAGGYGTIKPVKASSPV